MLTIHRGDSRGHTTLDWLDSRHSFSFGEFYDPERVSFRTLRVMNEDRVGPGGGFPTHPHRDMEILTYVLEGALEHKDSMGNASVIRAGELQRMSAGSGVTHSEFNHSSEAPVHFFQMWVVPERAGLEPGYEQRPFDRVGGLQLLASQDARGESLEIHQDVDLYLATLDGNIAIQSLQPDRHAWVQVIEAEISVNGETVQAGDAAQISGENTVDLKGTGRALLFDLG